MGLQISVEMAVALPNEDGTRIANVVRSDLTFFLPDEKIDPKDYAASEVALAVAALRTQSEEAIQAVAERLRDYEPVLAAAVAADSG